MNDEKGKYNIRDVPKSTLSNEIKNTFVSSGVKISFVKTALMKTDLFPHHNRDLIRKNLR